MFLTLAGVKTDISQQATEFARQTFRCSGTLLITNMTRTNNVMDEILVETRMSESDPAQPGRL